MIVELVSWKQYTVVWVHNYLFYLYFSLSVDSISNLSSSAYILILSLRLSLTMERLDLHLQLDVNT